MRPHSRSALSSRAAWFERWASQATAGVRSITVPYPEEGLMDILYYWKNMESDLKSGRIGYFRSDKEKLQTFKAGYPDFIWIFKTPQGRNRDVELLARLAWTDTATKGFTPTAGQSEIHYDPKYPRSGRFDSIASASGIDKTSNWMKRHFPAAVKANFVGSNGQQELRGEPLRELQEIAGIWKMEPLVESAAV
jgi:hypothetical protein